MHDNGLKAIDIEIKVAKTQNAKITVQIWNGNRK